MKSKVAHYHIETGRESCGRRSERRRHTLFMRILHHRVCIEVYARSGLTFTFNTIQRRVGFLEHFLNIKIKSFEHLFPFDIEECSRSLLWCGVQSVGGRVALGGEAQSAVSISESANTFR
ncbi:hypothetical protein EVAR_40930_1 [Eumeta japonica]|uniref:Uncharacterized protein n=1 Tax=Eumeta variegata TaxID=151549 RepID=A0A4C1X3S2_EUMVA|nr:hypothetical protein EVAR_40930_1 [Eumeta japonica]